MTRPLMTTRETAGILGCSTGALLRWARAGKVPSVKLPSGAVRFSPDAIDQWLAERASAESSGAAAPRNSVTRTSPPRRPGP